MVIFESLVRGNDFYLNELNLAENALRFATTSSQDKEYTSLAAGSTQNKSFDFLGVLYGIWSFYFHVGFVLQIKKL